MEGTKTALPNPNIHLYRDLLNSGLPIVFIHGFYPELSQCVHVVADDHAGGMQAVKYLHSKGRKNICEIFKSDDMQGVYRYSGFVEQLQKLNFVLTMIGYYGIQPNLGNRPLHRDFYIL